MRLLAWVFSGVLLGTGVCAYSAPIYRAGEKDFPARSILHGEVSVDYQFSSQKMQLVTQEDSTSSLQGFNLRGLWAPLSWLAIGAEMTQFNNEDLQNFFVSSYKTKRIGGLIKLTLSPNTSPRVYVLAGYGRTTHQLNYDHSSIMTRTWPDHDKKNVNYWMLGLGLETDVWRSVFMGIEGNILRHSSTKLVRYYETDSKTETVLRVRAGVRF